MTRCKPHVTILAALNAAKSTKPTTQTLKIAAKLNSSAAVESSPQPKSNFRTQPRMYHCLRLRPTLDLSGDLAAILLPYLVAFTFFLCKVFILIKYGTHAHQTCSLAKNNRWRRFLEKIY